MIGITLTPPSPQALKPLPPLPPPLPLPSPSQLLKSKKSLDPITLSLPQPPSSTRPPQFLPTFLFSFFTHIILVCAHFKLILSLRSVACPGFVACLEIDHQKEIPVHKCLPDLHPLEPPMTTRVCCTKTRNTLAHIIPRTNFYLIAHQHRRSINLILPNGPQAPRAMRQCTLLLPT